MTYMHKMDLTTMTIQQTFILLCLFAFAFISFYAAISEEILAYNIVHNGVNHFLAAAQRTGNT